MCSREEERSKADLHPFNLATVDLHRQILAPAAEDDQINLKLMLRSPADLKTGGRLPWLSLTNGGQRHFCSALFPPLWMLPHPLLVEMGHGTEAHHFPPIAVTACQRHGMQIRQFHLAYHQYGPDMGHTPCLWVLEGLGVI